ncbi:MAG TPA: S53 family peptidase [Actinocrinis sp.]|nr:S53 family peptidase [Actinocrinis sp.]
MKARLRLLGALAAPLPVLALATGPSFAAAAAPRAALHGEVLSAIGQSTRVGDMASNARVSVAVTLSPRDPAALDRFIAAVSDRTSPEYGHYLSPDQFASRFGPTSATVNQVTAYLASQGLKVTNVAKGNLVVDASGTAAQMETAFGTHLSNYKQGAKSYYANDAAPSLPTGIASSVVSVAGLDNYAKLTHTAVTPAAVSPRATNFTPAKIRSGYNLTSLISAGFKGTGEKVALIEFDGYVQSNITTYDNKFSLGVSSNPTKVTVDGGSGALGDGEVEVELDIEVVQAIAPGAAVSVYEAPNTDAGEQDMYAAMVSADVPVISSSWGASELDRTSANINAVDTVLKQAAAQGQSVYAASGDSGSADAANGATAVDYPASDPFVSGVGGTNLTETSAGAWSKEVAWSGSGGGVSVDFAKPSYQSALSGSFRSVPDVSTDGGPNSPWQIFTEGTWTQVWGTSAAAPSWAAFTAIYDQDASAKGKAALGFANPTLYAIGAGANYASAFHDIKSGSNGAFSAGTGYDRVSGWGSYNAGSFITDELG